MTKPGTQEQRSAVYSWAKELSDELQAIHADEMEAAGIPANHVRNARMLALTLRDALASAPPSLDVSKIAAVLREGGWVQGVAGRYGTFNQAYWDKSAADFAAAYRSLQDSAAESE